MSRLPWRKNKQTSLAVFTGPGSPLPTVFSTFGGVALNPVWVWQQGVVWVLNSWHLYRICTTVLASRSWPHVIDGETGGLPFCSCALGVPFNMSGARHSDSYL